MVALLVALTVLACFGTERFMTKGHGNVGWRDPAERDPEIFPLASDARVRRIA
jgi:hypothetical protein